MYYSVLYITLLSCFFVLLDRRSYNIFLICAISLFISFVSGLRAFSDADYLNYFNMYHLVPTLLNINLMDYRNLYGEPGYITFESFLKTIGAPFYILTICASFFSIFTKSYVIVKLSKNVFFIILPIYLCFHFITIEVIQIRWAIATSIIIFSYYLFLSGKVKRSFLLFFISFLFHYFSVVFILPLFFIKKKMFKIINVLLIFSVLFSLFSFFDIKSLILSTNINSFGVIGAKLSYYVSENGSHIGAILLIKTYALLIISYFIFIKNKTNLGYLVIALNIVLNMMTFLPLLFFRTMVVVDFFSLVLVINYINANYFWRFKFPILLVLLLCSSLWAINDVWNYKASGSISDYISIINY
ncbi:hypothetical protein C5F63_17800 [Photobacterium damselae subsp. damselae]|uniref:EpsG family protein n=1 Tax=Photobacterium damselae TaxID=38293 RepID=UPI000D062168|nr:EpsG family protein [Photobacterium damselae]PSB83910.1 hypothetical protein C5F63_17800 [Photobacterium damselae subsp. damselae]